MSQDHSLPDPTTQHPLHLAARLEDTARGIVERVLRRRGWQPRVLAYPGYATDGWVRVLARVLLTPPGTPRNDVEGARGWRRFLSAAVAGVPVTVTVGDRDAEVCSVRGGYVDVRIDGVDLPPGWASARLAAGSTASEAPLRVVGPDARLGIVSDIDDTVVVTALPRPLLAFWNTFVRREASRHAVPGMAQLYEQLLAQHDDVPVFYLSTGAWNVAPALSAFLDRNGFPPGPLLMTDWGPTAEGWFRSGQEHKRSQLRRLLEEFPRLRWILVGDDGQHDPALYDEAAGNAPGHVHAIAIRQLTTTEQVLTHGSPAPRPDAQASTATPEVRAPDGMALLEELRSRGLLQEHSAT